MKVVSFIEYKNDRIYKSAALPNTVYNVLIWAFAK